MDSQHGLNTPNSINVGAQFKSNSKKEPESLQTSPHIDADLNNQIFISHGNKNISPSFSYNSFSSNSSSFDQNENNKTTKKTQSSPSSSLVSSNTSPGQISSYFSSPIQVSTSNNLNLTIESNSSIQSPHQSDTESKQISKGYKFTEYDNYSEHSSKDSILSNSASNIIRSKKMSKKSNYDPIGDEIRKLEQN